MHVASPGEAQAVPESLRESWRSSITLVSMCTMAEGTEETVVPDSEVAERTEEGAEIKVECEPPVVRPK